ncbi:MAG: hypothetical protein WBA74_22750, partial [Cyclobacteriaceae bacterium]
MKTQTLLLIVTIYVLVGCSDEDPLPIVEPSVGVNSVNLSAPEGTQQSVYVRYTGKCGDDTRGVTFTGDTLTLTVDDSAPVLMFKETIKPGSPLLIDNQ